MKVVILSGKGGAGKTTVAASLSYVWRQEHVAVDMDVEAPNLHLFLKPQITGSSEFTVEVPQVDESRCIACRKCVELCNFSALSLLGKKLLAFNEMCHSCGGCFRICPVEALVRNNRAIGNILTGEFAGVDQNSIAFVGGRLNIGEALSPPLIDAIAEYLHEKHESADIIIDGPPGASCPAMSAIKDSDLIILVAEPTVFGFHDMQIIYEAVADAGIPIAVVINKADERSVKVREFCDCKGVKVLAEIPFDKELAQAYSNRQILAAYSKDMYKIFTELAAGVKCYV